MFTDLNFIENLKQADPSLERFRFEIIMRMQGRHCLEKPSFVKIEDINRTIAGTQTKQTPSFSVF